ncbi:unnamed protein product [Orchesella dallaii]|uniref:Uncharacterized protein n=1 Tax=Orchesella dallaii TaxID=48710 RepID=A0ABP1QT20_9HEXA
MTTLEQVLNEIDCVGCFSRFRSDLKKFDPRKPCFGFTLQNGILVIAIIDVIGGVLGVLPMVIWLTAMTLFKDLMQSIREDLTLQPMESAKTVETSFTVFLAILCMVISVCLLEFYLAMLLLNATKKKKVTSCYLYWRLVVVVLLVILFILGAVILRSHVVGVLVLGTVVILYKIYCFWVVKIYVERIGTEPMDNMDSLPTVCGETEEFTKL